MHSKHLAWGALATAILLAGCGGRAAAPAPAAAPAVEIVQAREGRLPLRDRLNGVVRAENQVQVRPEIEALVEQVLVESGAVVKKGQPLVRLRDGDLREQLAQAEAAVRLGRALLAEQQARVDELFAQVSRTEELSREDLVSAAELETQQARLAAARAAADSARARVDQAESTAAERRNALSKAVVRSPIAGRVGRRQIQPGQLVSTDQVLFDVGNLDELRIEIPLTDALMRSLAPGQPVVVRSQALAEPLHATLSRISPFLAQDSFSTTGEIDVANPGPLQPGLFVTVDVLQGESERGTLVPSSALWEDPEDSRQYVLVSKWPVGPPPPDTVSPEAHPVAARAVEVLAQGDGAVGVRGVAPDEWVVTVGQHLLGRGDGMQAHVRRTSWERVLELQGIQREDILRDFMTKQQELARTAGPVPPTTDEVRRRARQETGR